MLFLSRNIKFYATSCIPTQDLNVNGYAIYIGNDGLDKDLATLTRNSGESLKNFLNRCKDKANSYNQNNVGFVINVNNNQESSVNTCWIKSAVGRPQTNTLVPNNQRITYTNINEITAMNYLPPNFDGYTIYHKYDGFDQDITSLSRKSNESLINFLMRCRSNANSYNDVNVGFITNFDPYNNNPEASITECWIKRSVGRAPNRTLVNSNVRIAYLNNKEIIASQAATALAATASAATASINNYLPPNVNGYVAYHKYDGLNQDITFLSRKADESLVNFLNRCKSTADSYNASNVGFITNFDPNNNDPQSSITQCWIKRSVGIPQINTLAKTDFRISYLNLIDLRINYLPPNVDGFTTYHKYDGLNKGITSLTRNPGETLVDFLNRCKITANFYNASNVGFITNFDPNNNDPQSSITKCWIKESVGRAQNQTLTKKDFRIAYLNNKETIASQENAKK